MAKGKRQRAKVASSGGASGSASVPSPALAGPDDPTSADDGSITITEGPDGEIVLGHEIEDGAIALTEAGAIFLGGMGPSLVGERIRGVPGGSELTADDVASMQAILAGTEKPPEAVLPVAKPRTATVLASHDKVTVAVACREPGGWGEKAAAQHVAREDRYRLRHLVAQVSAIRDEATGIEERARMRGDSDVESSANQLRSAMRHAASELP